jgi:hypothetical protein
MTRWETLFGTTTATTDVVIQSGTTVVLHGCAQFNSTVNVRNILVQAGATVGAVWGSVVAAVWCVFGSAS